MTPEQRKAALVSANKARVECQPPPYDPRLETEGAPPQVTRAEPPAPGEPEAGEPPPGDPVAADFAAFVRETREKAAAFEQAKKSQDAEAKAGDDPRPPRKRKGGRR